VKRDAKTRLLKAPTTGVIRLTFQGSHEDVADRASAVRVIESLLNDLLEGRLEVARYRVGSPRKTYAEDVEFLWGELNSTRELPPSKAYPK
jgi:hypothetical protein